MKKRHHFNASFKSKVAIERLREQKTIRARAKQIPDSSHTGDRVEKKALFGNASEVFEELGCKREEQKRQKIK